MEVDIINNKPPLVDTLTTADNKMELLSLQEDYQRLNEEFLRVTKSYTVAIVLYLLVGQRGKGKGCRIRAGFIRGKTTVTMQVRGVDEFV
jgi:hypothetical protein